MGVIREFHSCHDSGVGKDLHAWHKQNRKVGRYQPRHSSAGVISEKFFHGDKNMGPLVALEWKSLVGAAI